MRWVPAVALTIAVILPFVFPNLVARAAPLFLFFPEGLKEADADPAGWGLEGAEQVWIRTEDGLRLHGWWAPAEDGEAAVRGAARGAAIFFHGNAGHLAHRAPIAARLRRLGLGVLLFDYRGYGRSDGRPSEAGLYLDGAAALRFLAEERDLPPERVLLLGHSLGAAVATRTAVESGTAGLVVTSTFRNLPSLARKLYRWVPARLFEWSRNRFDSESRIGRVAAPVLAGWGSGDEFIPREETRALYEAASEPKGWFQVQGAGHNELWWTAELWSELEAFVARALPAAAGSG
jgi:fermentation-respiration switch protein FrsA (DUF1100 family)